jgi:lipid-A-disaccharide synthase
MAAAGCELLYPLSSLAVMWFARVLAHAPVFLELVSRADRFFRHQRPDSVVLIDYPGFNWWLARRAHFHGIPVFYFVPPQLWAWAGWRVGKMRRWVDQVLCTLPFEEAWYHERGVPARYIGHPYFDELQGQQLDRAFLADQRSRPGITVGLLPGSRTGEVERNLPTLIETAGLIARGRPDARFLVACFKAAHQSYVDRKLKDQGLPIETFTGRTPEIIQLSRACVAVSGSVSLELLYREKPSVVVYGISSLAVALRPWIMKCPYVTLVNLLAQRELFPEYVGDRCEAEGISEHIVQWLGDPTAYDEKRRDLAALRRQVAVPGACDRAGRLILSMLGQKSRDAA